MARITRASSGTLVIVSDADAATPWISSRATSSSSALVVACAAWRAAVVDRRSTTSPSSAAAVRARDLLRAGKRRARRSGCASTAPLLRSDAAISAVVYERDRELGLCLERASAQDRVDCARLRSRLRSTCEHAKRQLAGGPLMWTLHSTVAGGSRRSGSRALRSEASALVLPLRRVRRRRTIDCTSGCRTMSDSTEAASCRSPRCHRSTVGRLAPDRWSDVRLEV